MRLGNAVWLVLIKAQVRLARTVAEGRRDDRTTGAGSSMARAVRLACQRPVQGPGCGDATNAKHLGSPTLFV